MAGIPIVWANGISPPQKRNPQHRGDTAGRSDADLNVFMGSWAVRPTSGILPSSTIITPSSHPAHRRRDTISPRISSTKPSSSSGTPKWWHQKSRSSCTSARAPVTPRTTSSRSGLTSTRENSIWATKRFGRESWRTRKIWACCQRILSSLPLTHTESPQSRVQMVSRGHCSTGCVLGTHSSMTRKSSS